MLPKNASCNLHPKKNNLSSPPKTSHFLGRYCWLYILSRSRGDCTNTTLCTGAEVYTKWPRYSPGASASCWFPGSFLLQVFRFLTASLFYIQINAPNVRTLHVTLVTLLLNGYDIVINFKDLLYFPICLSASCFLFLLLLLSVSVTSSVSQVCFLLLLFFLFQATLFPFWVSCVSSLFLSLSASLHHLIVSLFWFFTIACVLSFFFHPISSAARFLSAARPF